MVKGRPPRTEVSQERADEKGVYHMKLLDREEKAARAEELAAKWDPSKRAGWVKYYSTEYDYIEFEHDGEKRYIAVRRPGIKSEFWYDDEYDSPLTDDPEQRRGYFMAENLRSQFADFGISKWLECEEQLADHGCCSGLHLDEPYVSMWPSGECRPHFMGHEDDIRLDERRGMVRHVMDAGERAELMAIMDAQRAKFEKRLATYWKRYSDKVSACGYWANR